MSKIVEDLENMPEVDWDAEPSQPVETEKESHCAGPKEAPNEFIPEGNYQAVCVRFEIKKYLSSEKKLYLHYEIMQGKYLETKLFQAINYKYKSFPKASKYYTEWTIANGALPQRRDKMSPRIFKNRAFLVKVKTSKPKYDDGTFKPELFHYSTVERIIEVLT